MEGGDDKVQTAAAFRENCLTWTDALPYMDIYQEFLYGPESIQLDALGSEEEEGSCSDEGRGHNEGNSGSPSPEPPRGGDASSAGGEGLLEFF